MLVLALSSEQVLSVLLIPLLSLFLKHSYLVIFGKHTSSLIMGFIFISYIDNNLLTRITIFIWIGNYMIFNQRKISFLLSAQCGRPYCIFVLLPYHSRNANNGILLILPQCHRIIVYDFPIGAPYSRSNQSIQLLPTAAHTIYFLVYPLVSHPICFVKHP